MDSNTMKYGELLTALISIKDDNVDEEGNVKVVGVRDGSVETAIWTEKVYQDNQAQLGSGNKVLFIGQFEAAKTVSSNIYCNNSFEQYGINYGNLGNKAVIYVDKKVLGNNRNLYDEFFNQYQQMLMNSNTQYGLQNNIVKTQTAETKAHEKADVAAENVGAALNKGISFLNKGIGKIGDSIQKDKANKKEIAIPSISESFIKDTGKALGTAGASVGIEKASTDNAIMDQQYRCAIFSFYLNALAQFMD